MWPNRTVVYVNPFSTLRGFDDSERSRRKELFLDLFRTCVETEDDREELWAFEHLKALYFETIAGQDDRVPSFLDAMRWAAQATVGPA